MKVGKNVGVVYCKILLDITIDVVYKIRAFIVALEKPATTQNRLINQLENQGSYLQTALQDLRLEENIAEMAIFRPDEDEFLKTDFSTNSIRRQIHRNLHR
jgi:hypothetical protein